MKIIMSGSGSGGHIYPCIATYNKFKENHEIIIIIFKEIDKKIYDLNKVKYIYISDYLTNFEKLKQIKKIYKENNIDITMTFGGKNSLFINLIAKKFKSKIFIFEQNAIMGKANKINYLLCNKLFSTFNLNKKKEINIGNPNSFNIKCNKENIFNNDKITILFTLGSQGSSSVNKTICKFIKNNKDYNVIYVTGTNISLNINNLKNVKLYNYYNPLTHLIYNCDIIVCRAGASTLSEIIALNKPSIIIPSPYVTNNHQYKNAKILFNNNACLLIEEKDLNISILQEKIRVLSHNTAYYNNIKENLKKLHKCNNFELIKKEIENENL